MQSLFNRFHNSVGQQLIAVILRRQVGGFRKYRNYLSS